MYDNEQTAGHLLTRRGAARLLGAAGVAMALGAPPASGQSTCVVRPRQTAGPFFIDHGLDRSDIRADAGSDAVLPGLPLMVEFTVSRLDTQSCEPLAGAIVNLWQGDARGLYSGVFENRGRTFLRGAQHTDTNGRARFVTLYPGWYPGRAVHIHFRIRTEPSLGRGYEFTSQLYFDDALTDRVHARPPYDFRTGQRLRNDRDSLFRRGGDQLLLDPVTSGEGLAATFAIALKLPE